MSFKRHFPEYRRERIRAAIFCSLGTSQAVVLLQVLANTRMWIFSLLIFAPAWFFYEIWRSLKAMSAIDKHGKSFKPENAREISCELSVLNRRQKKVRIRIGDETSALKPVAVYGEIPGESRLVFQVYFEPGAATPFLAARENFRIWL